MRRPLDLIRRLLRPLRQASARRHYRRALARGEAAGDYRYVSRPWQPEALPLVELRLRADAVGEDEAVAWCRRQTLAELRAVGFGADGAQAWRIEPEAAPAPAEATWFAAPGSLPGVVPAHLESCLLVAAAEDVDAVALRERVPPSVGDRATTADAVLEPDLRPYALYRSATFRYDPPTDAVIATASQQLTKLVDSDGVADIPRQPWSYSLHRRGPYLSSTPLGPCLEVGVRDAALLTRQRLQADKPAILVLTSFLARGGAEHTLLETLRALRDRFEFAFVTLAPHRAALGDRRDDFRAISERLYCLGDLVHPAAMVGIIESLLDATGAEIVYNANGTTLFYEFAPRLKAARPGLRIVDHLYDHRVGYIDQYTPRLLEAVDACVAENNRIAEVLVSERGWPDERVPVVWPCGRARDAFPTPEQRPEVRRRLRQELGLADDDVVFLTAARMHPQKRPLDLVALAGRVRDLEQVHFLVVGGGDLEAEVDAAIAASGGARIRRLPFRTDIPDLVVAADVGCLVSDYEGLPVFMLECLQAGRPFLGTAVGDMGAVLRESEAGLVVERPGDLDSLEACVRRLVDADQRELLAERAAAAAPRFEVETCAERYAEAFVGPPTSSRS